MAEKPMMIRTALMPLYYKDFHCVMGACQCNCCDEDWRIEFSKKDYLTIKRAVQSEELKAVMSQSLRRLREREHDGMYAEFQMTEQKRCAFHTPEGLCRLQLECGEETLPLVCRSFPRRRTYTPAALEHSLSPACEGVLGLLWDLTEGIDFVEEPIHPREQITLWPSSPASARFGDIRSLCIDILQARAMSLRQRMLMLGIALRDLMEQNWEEAEVFDGWHAKWELLLSSPDAVVEQLRQMPQNRPMFLSHNLQTLFRSIEGELRRELLSVITDEDFTGEINLDEVTIKPARYQRLEGQMESQLGHSDYYLENLMVTVAFYLAFPDGKSPENMWKSYVNLCNIYSFYRFCAVCGCGKEVSRERLFYVLVQVSRSILHNSKRRNRFRDKLFQNDSATLAHMAILVGG